MASISSRLSRICQKLEDQSIVQRTKCEDDRRYTRIELTEKGDGIFEDLAPLAERQLERTLRGFSAEERKQLDRMLRRMKDNTYRSPSTRSREQGLYATQALIALTRLCIQWI